MKKQKLAVVIIILLITALIAFWIYDSEYHYPNTEAGRLAAVKDYVLSAEDSMGHVLKIGTPVEVLAWQTLEDRLYIFYRADNKYNVISIGESTKKSFRYKPSNRLYVSTIAKKMILNLVLVLDVFVVFISKSPLCTKIH